MNTAVEPSEAVGMSAKRLERIRPAMQAYVDRGVYAGINTLIARRGKVVHAGQFGWRDKEAGSPMTADTIFRLYSMTKPIVCVALMTLLEEARFTLIDPLAKYIPAFGAREGQGGRRPSGRSGSPDHAARSDDPHERPHLPFRRGICRRQDVPRGQAPGRPMFRLKPPLTIWRGFRWLSSRGRAGATASASTSPPG